MHPLCSLSRSLNISIVTNVFGFSQPVGLERTVFFKLLIDLGLVPYLSPLLLFVKLMKSFKSGLTPLIIALMLLILLEHLLLGVKLRLECTVSKFNMVFQTLQILHVFLFCFCMLVKSVA